jgi:hypothetical protein
LCFPELPSLFPDHSQIVDKTIIRIKSAHKWPAKVVLDTSLPAIPPSAGKVSQIAQLAPHSPDEGTEKEKLDGFAELKSVALAEDRCPTVRAKHTRKGQSIKLCGQIPDCQEVGVGSERWVLSV